MSFGGGFGEGGGHRATVLAKKRLQEIEDFKERKKQISEKERVKAYSSKFSSTTDFFEDQFKKDTVGLVTAEDFKNKREDLEKKVEEEKRKIYDKSKKLRERKKRAKSKKAKMLSFADDDEIEHEDSDDDATYNPVGCGKNPNVETAFLPDADRERHERNVFEELSNEWTRKQDTIKADRLEITYSYWDGSGHRRVIQVTKGTHVGEFLESVRRDLANEFHELRTTTVENLLYVKEDLIIPHNYSFYDLIINKARGKSGPLFHFDVHDDIRLVNDARVEKDESHAGKIVDRRWFERNKHIFPASRWEIYDPAVKRDSYSIHGSEVNKKGDPNVT